MRELEHYALSRSLTQPIRKNRFKYGEAIILATLIVTIITFISL